MKYLVGTRGSDLALAQTKEVIAALEEKNSKSSFELKVVKTSGDRKQGTPRAENGDKRDWMDELEVELVNEKIDLVVHSGKDVPVDISPKSRIFPVLRRDYPLDVFVGKKVNGSRLQFSDIKAGDIIGTASKRRAAQLLASNPDLQIIPWRGNINTRLKNLEDSTEVKGIILARAGLERTSLFETDMVQIDGSIMLPAVSQGLMAVQCRASDKNLCDLLSQLVNTDLEACFVAERQVVATLGADCHSAVASYAEVVEENHLRIMARVYSVDGNTCLESSATGELSKAVALGIQVGDELISKGALKVLEAARLVANG